jgi:hypothetical protein
MLPMENVQLYLVRTSADPRLYWEIFMPERNLACTMMQKLKSVGMAGTAMCYKPKTMAASAPRNIDRLGNQPIIRPIEDVAIPKEMCEMIHQLFILKLEARVKAEEISNMVFKVEVLHRKPV